MNYTIIRHQLHQLAEPSGEEFQTKNFILDTLKDFQPTHIHTFTNSNNLIAEYDFGHGGPTLLFRGDFDAVRVDETLDIPYISHNKGVAHKCGHDGHTTILLGLAEQLHEHPLAKGKVLLFFQAAEETGEGAELLLQTHFLDNYDIDQVYALHNIPGEPKGSIICREGSFTCSVISCDIVLNGRTSHAAEPLKAVNPYGVAVAITNEVLSYNQYDIEKRDYCLVTLIEMKVGERAYGVTAGNGVLRFTLRAKEDEVLQKTKTEVENIVNKEVAHIDGLNSAITWREYFAASHNQTKAVEVIREAANNIGLSYREKPMPFSWGEDFGLLTQHYGGALFGLGSGENQPSLHHPDFDFPDDIIPFGVKMFYTIALENIRMTRQKDSNR